MWWVLYSPWGWCRILSGYDGRSLTIHSWVGLASRRIRGYNSRSSSLQLVSQYVDLSSHILMALLQLGDKIDGFGK
jgi:hypothetical protein